MRFQAIQCSEIDRAAQQLLEVILEREQTEIANRPIELDQQIYIAISVGFVACDRTNSARDCTPNRSAISAFFCLKICRTASCFILKIIRQSHLRSEIWLQVSQAASAGRTIFSPHLTPARTTPRSDPTNAAPSPHRRNPCSKPSLSNESCTG
jgi:hypothetical protein